MYLFEELGLGLQLRVNVGAGGDQDLGGLRVTRAGGEHEGSTPGVCHGVHVVALADQHLAGLGSPLSAGGWEGGGRSWQEVVGGWTRSKQK